MNQSLEVLYDHYKDTYQLSLLAQKERDHLFVKLCLTLTTLLLIIVDPNTLSILASTIVENELKIIIPHSLIIVQSFLWALLLYFFASYFRKILYIERQYVYIHELEVVIAEILDKKFTREGNSYLEDYPMILNFTHYLYQLIFPVLSIIIVVYKIYLEIISEIFLIAKIFDFVMGISVVIVIILYFYFTINKKNE